MPKCAKPTSSMPTSYVNSPNHYTLQLLHGHLMHGDWMSGPIAPKSFAEEVYILAATDYFSKWVEAIPLREVKKETVIRFIKENIIHRYDVPRYIITDNGKQFSNQLMDELCKKYKFKQHKSSMYHSLANGLAEAFNKTLCNLLKNVVGRTKRDWHERIYEALWAYRTTHRTPT